MINIFETIFKAQFNLCSIIDKVLNQDNPLISLLVDENPFGPLKNSGVSKLWN